MLLASACGRLGYEPEGSGGNATDGGNPADLIDAGNRADAKEVEPIALTVDRVASDAIYGSFAGFDPQLVGGVDVLDEGGTVRLSLTKLTTVGTRFAILLGDETLAGLGVTVKLRDAQGNALAETAPMLLPATDDVSVVTPRGMHLSYFTNEFYIGLAAAGTHCFDLVGEDGQVHTAEGCVQLNDVDNVLVSLSQLSGTIEMRARYSLCERGLDQVTSCSSLVNLRNNMAVDRLVLDTANSLFSIVLGGNLSFCIRIMDENQTQIQLTDPGSPHACVSTYISGYLSQDIPLSELTSAIDPLLQYAICNIDNRGLAYSECSPLGLLEMP
jgi:hypothetical protein